MNEQLIKKTLDSSGGKALKTYLEDKLNELKDISSIKDIDNPNDQAVEMKAQRKAYLKMREIFEDIMTLDEDIREKDPRDSYDTL